MSWAYMPYIRSRPEIEPRPMRPKKGGKTTNEAERSLPDIGFEFPQPDLTLGSASLLPLAHPGLPGAHDVTTERLNPHSPPSYSSTSPASQSQSATPSSHPSPLAPDHHHQQEHSKQMMMSPGAPEAVRSPSSDRILDPWGGIAGVEQSSIEPGTAPPFIQARYAALQDVAAGANAQPDIGEGSEQTHDEYMHMRGDDRGAESRLPTTAPADLPAPESALEPTSFVQARYTALQDVANGANARPDIGEGSEQTHDEYAAAAGQSSELDRNDAYGGLGGVEGESVNQPDSAAGQAVARDVNMEKIDGLDRSADVEDNSGSRLPGVTGLIARRAELLARDAHTPAINISEPPEPRDDEPKQSHGSRLVSIPPTPSSTRAIKSPSRLSIGSDVSTYTKDDDLPSASDETEPGNGNGGENATNANGFTQRLVKRLKQKLM